MKFMKDKILNIKKCKINELLFAWYISSSAFLVPISIMFGVNIYRFCFAINLIIIFIISMIKNKKIILKQDFILLLIVTVIFLIDFIFRRNGYVLKTYFEFIKMCFIPCYLFNRTSNIKYIMKYLANFSKVAIILFIFDPLFDYYFSSTYMGYGSTILPAFFAIYIFNFINHNKTNFIFIILALVFTIIYGNRACLLSIIFIIILTSGFIFNDLKKRKIIRNINIINTAKRTFLITIVFVLSFGINYLIVYTSKNDVREIFNNMKDQVASHFSQVKTDGTTNKIVNDNNVKNPNKDSNNEIINKKIDNNGSRKESIDNKNGNTTIDKKVNKKTTENKSNDKEKILDSNSYSLKKYEEAISGKYNTILAGRGKIYEEAINVIKNEKIFNLFAGNGTGYFRTLNSKGAYSHSIIFDLIIEYGLIGLFAFSILGIYCLTIFFRKVKREKFLFASYLLCLAFPKLLLSLYFQKDTYLWVFIIYMMTFALTKKYDKKVVEKELE